MYIKFVNEDVTYTFSHEEPNKFIQLIFKTPRGKLIFLIFGYFITT